MKEFIKEKRTKLDNNVKQNNIPIKQEDNVYKKIKDIYQKKYNLKID